MNIDSHHLHFIIGRREEDVRRTSEQDGDGYLVYYFNKKQDLHIKLSSMGITETKYKKLEMLEPAYYEKLKKSGCEEEKSYEVRERERWKRYNQYYYYNIQEQKREEELEERFQAERWTRYNQGLYNNYYYKSQKQKREEEIQELDQADLHKTGSGNQREIEVNGKKLATGDYKLTDNSFSTKITLGSDWIEPKITWEGKLPNSQAEAEAFFLKNNIQVHVTGSKRNLDLSLNWKMTKPDFNFGTPENGKLSLNAKGHNPRWGDYSLSRDLNWSIANKVAEVNLTGSAQFAKGLLATATPIETSFKFKVLLDQKDLIGKFMKKINGKEYSIDFPQGSGAMPRIIMGQ